MQLLKGQKNVGLLWRNYQSVTANRVVSSKIKSNVRKFNNTVSSFSKPSVVSPKWNAYVNKVGLIAFDTIQKNYHVVSNMRALYAYGFLQQPQALFRNSRHLFFSFLFFSVAKRDYDEMCVTDMCVTVSCVYVFIHVYTIHMRMSLSRFKHCSGDPTLF